MEKIILAILLLAASNVQATIVTYEDKNTWLNDLSGQIITTENFNELDYYEGVFQSGSSRDHFIGDLAMAGDWDIYPGSGDTKDKVIGFVNTNEANTISFNSEIFAFSGLWDLPLNDSSESFGPGFTVRAGSVDLFTLTGGFTGFFGIITDFSFGEISIVSTSGEMFSLDDLSFIESTVVPVPATVWLFGSGLLGLLAASRRKYTAKRYV